MGSQEEPIWGQLIDLLGVLGLIDSGGSKGSVNLGDIWPMGVRRSRYDQ